MRKTIKKGLSLVLACLLIMSVAVVSVAAESQATLTIGSVSAQAGEQITVPVSISADSGVTIGSFAINFNSSFLTLNEVVYGEEGMLELGSCIVGVTEDNKDQIGVAIVGPNLSTIDAEGGVLFNLVFTVNNAVPTTEETLSVDFTNVRDTDNNGLFADQTMLDVTLVDGIISITGIEADVPAITLESITADAGAAIEVPLTITENSCVISGAFCIGYDSNVLEYTGYTDGELENVSQLLIDETADEESAVGVVFSTENATSAIVAGGTIATLKFNVKANAPSGDSHLKFQLVRPDDVSVLGGVATSEALVENAIFNDATITISSAVTTTEVTFVVTPDNATIEFNGEIIEAFEGYATFEDVAFGEKEYTVSAEGYPSKTGTVVVEEGMAEVEVILEKVTTADVVFNVTPADAQVTLGDVTVTAVDGVATFEDVTFGTYNYTVAKEDYETATGSVTVAEDTAPVTVVLTAITTTDVVFNVTPVDAQVTLNGVTISATDGVATFEDVEYGTYSYSVAKTGYETATGDVTVEKGMEAVNVTLTQTPAEDTTPVPQVYGLRTYGDVTYDPETKTVTAIALSYNPTNFAASTAGVALVIDGITNNNNYTTSSAGISTGSSSGRKYFIAKPANGMNQIYTINAKLGDQTYTYTVNMTFYDVEPGTVEPIDFITSKCSGITYMPQRKKIRIESDYARIVNMSTSVAFGLIPPEGGSVSYAYVSNSLGLPQADVFRASLTTTNKYSIYSEGIDIVKEMTSRETSPRVQAIYYKNEIQGSALSVITNVTVKDKDGNSTVYEVEMAFRNAADQRYDQGNQKDFNIVDAKVLRANQDSLVIDNENATIYFESTTDNLSAGIAFNVGNGLGKKYRPRRVVYNRSGYGLAYGDVNTSTHGINADVYDRFTVAKLANGTYQTFEIFLCGGADGLDKKLYTVTVKFNRVYQGDIEFTGLKTSGVDEYDVDHDTNTVDVYYSGNKAAIAPIFAETVSVKVISGTVTATAIDGKRAYSVSAANGAEQTVTLRFKVGNDTTDYTVNFHHTGA